MGRKKLTYSFVKKQIENEGYKLLSKKYENNSSKIKVQCIKGHEYKIDWNNFQKGIRCSICAGNKKLTYNFIKNQIEKKGYKLLSKKYINTKNKLKVQCINNHEYLVSYDDFQQGKRCPICFGRYSKTEKEILKITKCFLPNNKIIANDRTQIINPLTGYSLELDIWIPELNKAIEYNGEYWHNNKYSKYKDNQKVEQCQEKNIDLLVIQEQNWLNNEDKEIGKIEKWTIKNI